MKTTTARIASSCLAALLAMPLLVEPAVALTGRATAGTTTLSTGTWAAAPVTTATSPNSQTALYINSLNKKNNTYFWVRNFGSFAIQSFTLAQSVAATGQSPTVEIQWCSGVWDTTRDTCSGTITVLLSTGDGLTSSALVALPIAVGSSIELAAHPTKNGMATTISTSVARTSIRGARTSNA